MKLLYLLITSEVCTISLVFIWIYYLLYLLFKFRSIR